MDNDCTLLSRIVFYRLSRPTHFPQASVQAVDARTTTISSQLLRSLRDICSFSSLHVQLQSAANVPLKLVDPFLKGHYGQLFKTVQQLIVVLNLGFQVMRERLEQSLKPMSFDGSCFNMTVTTTITTGEMV